jgi:hypothetical protein
MVAATASNLPKKYERIYSSEEDFPRLTIP